MHPQDTMSTPVGDPQGQGLLTLTLTPRGKGYPQGQGILRGKGSFSSSRCRWPRFRMSPNTCSSLQ